MSQLESPGLRHQRREQFLTRKSYLEKFQEADTTEEHAGHAEDTTFQSVVDRMDHESSEKKTWVGKPQHIPLRDGSLRRRRERQKSVTARVEIIGRGQLEEEVEGR